MYISAFNNKPDVKRFQDFTISQFFFTFHENNVNF